MSRSRRSLFPVSPVPRDGWSPSAAGRRCRDTLRASTPEDDLSSVDLVAGTVGRRSAGGVADRAVDVGDGTARSADDVVMVVPDAGLVAGHGARRLEAPYQASGGHAQAGPAQHALVVRRRRHSPSLA